MKKLIIAGVALIILAGIGFKFGRPAYRQMKERRCMAQARLFLEKNDRANALLDLRRALQVNPGNIEAATLMAELAEQGRSPYALVWRRRVAELAPTLTNRLLLASCSLRFQPAPFPLAEKSLKEIGEAGRSNAAYYVVSSELALLLNRLAEAEQDLQAAANIEPQNESHQMSLAVLRLLSKDAAVAAAARARLEGLRTSRILGGQVLRSLIADGLNRKDFEAAEKYSTELLANTNAVPSDRVTRLAILRAKKDPSFGTFLADAQRRAATNAVDVAELCRWMSSCGMMEEALTWVNALDKPVQSQLPVPAAVAECYVRQQDWKGLEMFLRDQQWQEQEFMRLAWLARAQERQGEKTGMRVAWQKALRAVADSGEMASVLAKLADGWGWKPETEEVLWQIVNRYPGEVWAGQALVRVYYADGNTRGLRRIYLTLLDRNPTDAVLKNNLATCCLLLRTDLGKAHEYAREVVRQDPKNSRFASTYAFSLYVQGNSGDAIKVLDSLPREELEKPAIAAYYGIILAGAGQSPKAQRYLALAQKEPELLPEEKALVEKALETAK